MVETATRGGFQDLLEIEGPQEDIDTLFHQLKQERIARVVDRMHLGRDRALALVTVPRCRAACDAIGENAFLVAQETNGGERTARDSSWRTARASKQSSRSSGKCGAESG